MSTVVVISGVKSVLKSVPLFETLAERSGLPDLSSRLKFQLSVPYFGAKVPHAIVLRNEEAEIFAVALLLEYRFFRMPSGIFTPVDEDGDLTLIALPEHRLEAAAVTAKHLLEHHRGIVFVRMAGRFEKSWISGCALQPVSTRVRSLRRKLPLLSAVDETLAQMGARSRRNLRAYSRRAVREMGAVYQPDVRMTEEDLVRFNRACSYPVPDWVAELRFRSIEPIAGSFLSGLRAEDGRWLSLIGGRRHGRETTIDWQMNRADLGTLSIGTAMRFFQIRWEIERGMRSLEFSGGTAHSIQNAFPEEPVTELLWMSWPYSSSLVRMLVGRLLQPTNALKGLLSDSNVDADPGPGAPDRESGSGFA